MPTQATIDGPLQGTETGLPADSWIAAVRRRLQAYSKWRNDTKTADGVQGAVGAGGLPYQMATPPVMDGSVTVRVNGSAQTIVATYPPGSGVVFVNLDTGEIFFGTVPPLNANLSWDYQYTPWRDQDILDALMAGVRDMWTTWDVGKVYTDETIVIQNLQWEYLLPQAAQDLNSRILRLEYITPYIPQVLPFQEVRGWKRIGVERLFIPRVQAWFPGNLRLTYYGPSLRLGDVPPQHYWPLVWYALSALLPWKESQRIRDDRAPNQINENAQQPGLLTQTGDYYYQRYEQVMVNLQRKAPKADVHMVSTYDMAVLDGYRG
jgi:hypothetical protein